MKKPNAKFYALMLAAIVVLVTIIAPVYAAPEDVDVVGYATDRVVYVNTVGMTDLKTVTELTEDTYKITDVAGFDKLEELIMAGVSFAGKTIYLANDVNFEGVTDFEPIGYKETDAVNASPSASFNGIFDGQGNMVNNLVFTKAESNKSNAADHDNIGFFGMLKDATIKNFIIGPDCSFTTTADSHDHGCMGGIAGTAWSTTIDNCMNMAELDNNSRFTGGMIGRQYGVTTITNSTNVGELRGCQSVGGMVGFNAAGGGDLTITNCRNVGDLELFKGYDENGGFVGSNSNIGAMVGWVQSTLVITGSINNGNISGFHNVGGFTGEMGTNAVTLKDNIDYGTSNLVDTKNETSKCCDDKLYCHGTPAVDENNSVLRGGEDETLNIENIVPDYTPDSGNGGITPPPASDTQQTTAATEQTSATAATTQATTAATTQATTAKATTATPTTATPTTAAATTAPATLAPTEPAEEGCQSTVIGGIAVILLVSGAALTLVKKKED